MNMKSISLFLLVLFIVFSVPCIFAENVDGEYNNLDIAVVGEIPSADSNIENINADNLNTDIISDVSPESPLDSSVKNEVKLLNYTPASKINIIDSQLIDCVQKFKLRVTDGLGINGISNFTVEVLCIMDVSKELVYSIEYKTDDDGFLDINLPSNYENTGIIYVFRGIDLIYMGQFGNVTFPVCKNSIYVFNPSHHHDVDVNC